MKTLILAAGLALGVLLAAGAQSTDLKSSEPVIVQASQTNSSGRAASPETQTAGAPAPSKAEGAVERGPLSALGPDELRLNFRNAPLESVLNYLSEAEGFIILTFWR
jgi:hypothetical protein